ncbi:MAG TPA: DUF2269 family protein [Gemmatimonadaceae bacterium]|nr:DUF2269 family protein [Gemmatimonadaceae bacterium]
MIFSEHTLRLLRVVHVLAAILFLGNVIVTGVWSTLMHRQRATVDFRHAARAIIVTDWLFTVGGAMLLVASGLSIAIGRGYPVLGTRWIRDGVIGLAIATAIWLIVLVPVQRRLVRCGPGDEAERDRLFQRWNVAGWCAVLPLLYSLWSMIYKPA